MFEARFQEVRRTKCFNQWCDAHCMTFQGDYFEVDSIDYRLGVVMEK
jgi:hypothetical protein